MAHTPQIALGDALGSNIVNVGLILGLAIAISPIREPRESAPREFAAAMLVPFALTAMIADGELSRLDAIVLMGAFALWLAAVFQGYSTHAECDLVGLGVSHRRDWPHL
jgi:cation:H+ antiporter